MLADHQRKLWSWELSIDSQTSRGYFQLLAIALEGGSLEGGTHA